MEWFLIYYPWKSNWVSWKWWALGNWYAWPEHMEDFPQPARSVPTKNPRNKHSIYRRMQINHIKLLNKSKCSKTLPKVTIVTSTLRSKYIDGTNTKRSFRKGSKNKPICRHLCHLLFDYCRIPGCGVVVWISSLLQHVALKVVKRLLQRHPFQPPNTTGKRWTTPKSHSFFLERSIIVLIKLLSFSDMIHRVLGEFHQISPSFFSTRIVPWHHHQPCWRVPGLHQCGQPCSSMQDSPWMPKSPPNPL